MTFSRGLAEKKERELQSLLHERVAMDAISTSTQIKHQSIAFPRYDHNVATRARGWRNKKADKTLDSTSRCARLCVWVEQQWENNNALVFRVGQIQQLQLKRVKHTTVYLPEDGQPSAEESPSLQIWRVVAPFLKLSGEK